MKIDNEKVYVDNQDGECPESEWFPGVKIARQDSMPERAWGAYLPGDEPGYRCRLLNEPCPGCPRVQDCPRVRYAGFCPDCLLEQDNLTQAFVDPVDEQVYCPVCGEIWEDFRDFQAEQAIFQK